MSLSSSFSSSHAIALETLELVKLKQNGVNDWWVVDSVGGGGGISTGWPPKTIASNATGARTSKDSNF